MLLRMKTLKRNKGENMEKIYFKLKRIDKETPSTFVKSKILGSPVFPMDYFNKHNLDDKYFVMQINLEELTKYKKDHLLPKVGYLYLFLDVASYPFKPVVLYTNDEVECVYDDINENFLEYGDYFGYELNFCDNDKFAHYILGEIDLDMDLDCEIDTTGYVVLLQFDSLELPNNVLQLGNYDGWYIFLIKEEDLKNHNFENVIFLEYGS